MLKDAYNYVEHKEKATYSLGYKLTSTWNVDNSVLNNANATNIGKIKINAIELYVPHYTPSIPQQATLSKQILSKVPTELQYVDWSVLTKEVITQNLRSFKLGTQEGINVPIWIIVGFHQRDRHDSQISNNDTFYRPPVTIAHCIIGTEKYPGSAILLKYNDGDYSQGYGQIKETFRAPKKTEYRTHIYITSRF